MKCKQSWWELSSNIFSLSAEQQMHAFQKISARVTQERSLYSNFKKILLADSNLKKVLFFAWLFINFVECGLIQLFIKEK